MLIFAIRFLVGWFVVFFTEIVIGNQNTTLVHKKKTQVMKKSIWKHWKGHICIGGFPEYTAKVAFFSFREHLTKFCFWERKLKRLTRETNCSSFSVKLKK